MSSLAILLIGTMRVDVSHLQLFSLGQIARIKHPIQAKHSIGCATGRRTAIPTRTPGTHAQTNSVANKSFTN
jgi:hypothetical protein